MLLTGINSGAIIYPIDKQNQTVMTMGTATVNRFNFDGQLSGDCARWDTKRTAIDKEIEDLAKEFKRAVYTQNLNDPADFARSYHDIRSDTWVRPTIEDEIASALANKDQATISEVYELLKRAALGEDIREASDDLIDRMAFSYALNA